MRGSSDNELLLRFVRRCFNINIRKVIRGLLESRNTKSGVEDASQVSLLKVGVGFMSCSRVPIVVL